MLKLTNLPLSVEQKQVINYLEKRKLYTINFNGKIFSKEDFKNNRNLANKFFNERESIIRNTLEDNW